MHYFTRKQQPVLMKGETMSSVTFNGGKCHDATETKAIMRHACADERIHHTHTNEDIDITKTALNSDLHNLSYADMCERYDAAMRRYRERAAKAIRKDAVTLYDAIITVPKDLPADKEDDWYRDVEQVINTHYEKPVVLDIKIHRDEIHEYTDPATGEKVTSRTHGHCFMFPDINGRLCAKQFSSKTNMRSLNREIDVMSREKYHCRFLTGELAKDRQFQSVEQLKRASDNAELQRQTQELQRQAQKAHEDIQAMEHERGILTSAEVAERKIDAKPAFLHSDKVMLDRDTFDELTNTAALVDAAREEAKDAARKQKAKDDAVRKDLEQKLMHEKDRADKLQHTLDSVNCVFKRFNLLSLMQSLAKICYLENHWRNTKLWKFAFGQLRESTILDGKHMETQQFVKMYDDTCKDMGVSVNRAFDDEMNIYRLSEKTRTHERREQER